MKLRTILTCIGAAVLAAWLAAGCGSSSSANTVTVTITSSVGTSIIVGQSTTLTATVTGGTTTNTAVNWQPCQFTTTTVSGTTTTTSTAAACPTDGSLGTLSNELTTGTATYTAPNKVPDQTKFPGLQVIITAQSQQDTSKTGNIKLILDSGIGITLTPTTATVATNEPQGFSVVLSNDLQSQGVTWLLTQSTATTTISEPNLVTCSPGCGSISASTATTMTYTAPATVPTASTPAGASTTPASLTIVATAKADNTRFATGTITIIQGGPITFNGISPTIAPQGAALWDIYLDAPNMSSASKIIITDQNGGSKTFDSLSGQIKVIFPIPTSTTPNPAPSGARLRLQEADLAGATSPTSGTPLTYTVSVTDPGEPVTKGAGPFTFTLMPVRPTLVASSPNGVVQGQQSSEFPVAIDGGYFGPAGTFASASFQGNALVRGPASTSRQIIDTFQSANISTSTPGLYPLSVSRSTQPLPSPNNPAVSTVAVFSDYHSGATPVAATAIPAGINPSAIDIDPTLGVIAVAETGSNAVQFFQIGAGTLTSLGSSPVGQTPTGLSVNRTNHCVAVVNYGSQSVSIVPIPGSSCPVPANTPPIDLSQVLQGVVTPAPLPYAIGVDPDTNLALVAYSSTSTSSFANLGFVVNLNQGTNPPFGCLGGFGTTGPCVLSEVTLNTGQYPQVAMAQHGHMAYVTPGGSGVLKGVDVTAPSASVALGTLAVTAGVVTATTANGATLNGLVPGLPTTALISGAPSLPGNINLNGVFPISITSSTSFQYSLGSNETTASGNVSGGTVFYGSPNLSFGIPIGSQGIAINPIARTAAIANQGAATQQVNLLNQLDQSVSSITFQEGCTFFITTTPPCGGTELPSSTAAVAWQPYTNSIVSYNPDRKEVSISEPVTHQRYAIVPVNGASSASIPVPNVTGTGLTLRLWGGVAVDPVTNQAFVVESGTGPGASGQLEIINLAPAGILPANALQPAQITELVVPSPTPGPGIIGGIPNALVPQATLTSTSPLGGVQIFGRGFVQGATQVRLDGVDIAPLGGTVNVPTASAGREADVTIPASFLSLPHRFALDVVVSSGSPSNATDFIVMKAIDMTPACNPAPPITSPSSVAIADQLKNQAFSPVAVVTNSQCNNISLIDINPVPGSATFGTITHTIPVGGTPQGVAISSHLGFAVVANNGAGTASVIDLVNLKEAVPDVTVGTSPIGVAVNESSGVALVANFGSNTVSQINLGLLVGSSPATTLTATSIGGVQAPIAVAIDPDRGTNNQGLAVVTGLQLVSGSSPNGALYPVDIGLASPALSTTVSIGSVSSTPSGIVFDPAVAPGGGTGLANPGLFYVNSSGSNVISSFNADNSTTAQTSVGINPTALAVNPQTGAILTTNFAGKSTSIVDTLSAPIRTVQTYGLPGSVQFGVAIDPFTNLAVIVDQAHNRVLLFPMPN